VSQSLPQDEVIATLQEPSDCRQLPVILERLAEQEAKLTERFYEVFFELRPDSLPLFGVHSISEREEMIRETLRSLYAWAEGEPWLGDNLDALGRSHWEYGVTADMYPSFVDAMLECVRELLGDFLDAEKTHDLQVALEAVCTRMRLAGDDAESSA
jgi:hemoglobin-like flavoprotein